MTKGTTVACIGLGKIGSGIAGNIVQAGFDTVVWNRGTRPRLQPLIDAGARRASTAREAAMEADVVISCLFDDQSVLDTTLGPDGILAGVRPGAVHAGTTSVSPSCSRQLTAAHGEHGGVYIAAHVLGRPEAARSAQLLVLAAGPAAAVDDKRRTRVLQPSRDLRR